MRGAVLVEIIELMARDIASKFDPLKVIVFGSWARGEAGPDSDVDLLVILNCTRDKKRDMQVAIRKELRKFKVPKDIVVATPEDIEEYKDAWWTVYHPALQEGKVLYEQ
ncbi:MAG: nucleotidyltransferase domain-containing protein [Firmicutes bacterium]|nr:nucleotidyltransferase domain-containing protein [Bacillota bacterium]